MRWQTIIFIILFTGIGFFTLTLALPTDAQSDPQSQKISESLQQQLAEADDGELIPILIKFADKANLDTRLPQAEVSRRAEIVSRLQATASASQVGVLAQLQGRSAGEVAHIRQLWIVNQLAAHVSADLIPILTADPQVTAITNDAEVQLIDPEPLDHDGVGHNDNYPEGAWGVEHVHAPDVWQMFGITGTGVVVAIMDTGVDWQHPALADNYRGRNGDHAASWFSSVYTTTLIPDDPHGHGTHVAGSAVGHNQLGVAPGAEWIGVQILNASGSGSISGIHAGFQWLLAPGGDPNNAPDVVNNSWGSSTVVLDFVDDVRALQAAGIMPIFAAGNSGPWPGTVGSPADYPDVFSVGAHDHTGHIAWFSSRGASSLTSQTKPSLTAPGTRIYSAFPEDRHGTANGTSMATPHVAGIIALLKSAEPTLTESDISYILTSTVKTDGLSNLPDTTYGWGYANAYAAVATQRNMRSITFAPQFAGAALSIPAYLTITQVETGRQMVQTIPANDQAVIQLEEGFSYQVTAAAFGMQMILNSAESLTTLNAIEPLVFNRLPNSHTVSGRVQTSAGNGVAVQISADGTPLTTHSSANGDYALVLPAGSYTLTTAANGWQRAVARITLANDHTETLIVTPTATTLLIDNGGWRYRSEIAYYQDALNELGIGFDKHEIIDPVDGYPPIEQLNAYDIVIWSDPTASPGAIQASGVLSQYLDAGGNLLISGQYIGILDANSIWAPKWWTRHLQARYLGITEPGPLRSVSELSDPGSAEISQFAGMSFDLNGGDSADNQTQTDVVEWEPFSLTTPLFETEGGLVTALAAGLCQPHKIVYLGFGLEGVQTATDRTDLLRRTYQYFTEPPPEHGISILHDPIDNFVLPGDVLSYTLQIANVSELHDATISLSVDSSWPVSISPATIEVDSCQSEPVVLTLTVPDGVANGTTFVTSIVADTGAITKRVPLLHRTAGSILFVDDDRWYDYDQHYRNELDRLGVQYDYWNVGWKANDGHGSISAELLNLYDIVIWYTGADWFQPLSRTEMEMLSSFIDAGGRVFLTGQSILSHHSGSTLRQYLGVYEWQDSVPVSATFGDHRQALPSDWGTSSSLNFTQYPNYSDGLTPSGSPVAWSDAGLAAGIAVTNETGFGNPWRVVFWGVAPEVMTDTAAASVVNQSVGWLSDLGESTVEVDQPSTADGATRTYTVTVRNLPEAPQNDVAITNTLPVSLTLNPATLVGATYDAGSRQITWSGALSSGGQHQIVYQATVSGTQGQQIDNLVQFGYARHRLQFERTARVGVGVPDVRQSTLSAEFTLLGNPITYTFQMTNTGDTGVLSATVYLPAESGVLTDTLHASSGTAHIASHQIHWMDTLARNETLSLTVVMTSALTSDSLWLYNVARITDGFSNPIVRDLLIQPAVHEQRWFPLILRR